MAIAISSGPNNHGVLFGPCLCPGCQLVLMNPCSLIAVSCLRSECRYRDSIADPTLKKAILKKNIMTYLD